MIDTIRDFTLWRLEAPLGRMIGDNNCHYDEIGIVALRLRTGDGREGWGYGESCWKGVFTRNAWYIKPMADEPDLHAGFDQSWWPLLEGRSIDALDEVRAQSKSDLFYLDSAARMALWDLKAKSAGVPLYQLLGGDAASNRVSAYGSILDFPLDEAAATALASSFVARGFRAIKVKVGAPDVERDITRLSAIREAVGSTIELTADGNEAWNAATALARLQAYESAGIRLGYIEDPLPHDDVQGFIELARNSPVPLVAHDYIHTIEEVDAFLNAGCLDRLRVGKDVDFSLDCAAAARTVGTPLIFGNSLLEYNVHLAVALPNVDRLEFSDLAWNALPREPVRFEDGYAVAPPGPGHGLDPKMDMLESWHRPAEAA